VPSRLRTDSTIVSAAGRKASSSVGL
jgi:hypothetical protein